MKEHKDGKWLIIELVPDFIEAHSGIQFGSPTVVGSRIHTEVAAGAYEHDGEQGWGGMRHNYPNLTKQRGFAALCFEAGREYQRNRKLRKRIKEACHEGWQQHNKEEADKNKGAGI